MADEFYLKPEEVRFIGHVPDEEMFALYRASDVFLSLSEHEGFCLPARREHDLRPARRRPRRPRPSPTPSARPGSCSATVRPGPVGRARRPRRPGRGLRKRAHRERPAGASPVQGLPAGGISPRPDPGARRPNEDRLRHPALRQGGHGRLRAPLPDGRRAAGRRAATTARSTRRRPRITSPGRTNTRRGSPSSTASSSSASTSSGRATSSRSTPIRTGSSSIPTPATTSSCGWSSRARSRPTSSTPWSGRSGSTTSSSFSPTSTTTPTGA